MEFSQAEMSKGLS